MTTALPRACSGGRAISIHAKLLPDTRWFPSVLKAFTIIRPETLVRWHRAGFRRYWRWKSRSLGGRPKIAADLRALIRRMSAENPLWGAPRRFLAASAYQRLAGKSLGAA
jgi:hypothetical protein